MSVYADGSFTGSCARLSAGAFSRNADFGFNDNITSVRFNDGVPCYRVTSPYPAATISYVPFAVELYADPSYSGLRTTIVQQTSDLRAVHGAAFNDSATALRILRGPNYSAGLGVQLHRDTGFADIGYPIGGAPYLNGDLRSINFNDNISGIRFR